MEACGGPSVFVRARKRTDTGGSWIDLPPGQLRRALHGRSVWTASEEMETVLNRTILVLRINCAGNVLSVSAGEVLAYCFPSGGGGVCVDMGRTDLENRDRPDIPGGVSVARLQSHQGTAFQTRTVAQPPSDCSSFSPLLIKR